jgi:hypothetical protein
MVAGSNSWAAAPTIPYGSDSAPTPSVGLTVEAGETFPNGWGLNRSAWWRFTAPATETVGIELLWSLWEEGDQPDPVVSVYTGSEDATSPADLTRVAFDDDNDRDIPRLGSDLMPDLDFAATAGTTYWVQVALWSSSVDMQYVVRLGKRIETVTDWLSDPAYQIEQNRDHLYHSTGDVQTSFDSPKFFTQGGVNVDARPFVIEALSTLPDGLPNGDLNTARYGVFLQWGSFTVAGEEVQETFARVSHALHLRLLSPYNLTYYYPAATKPPEAVGWEWETDPGTLTNAPDHSTPTAVVLLGDSELATTPEDSSSDPEVGLTSEYVTRLHATRVGASDFWSDAPDGSSWPSGYFDRITAWTPDYIEDDLVGVYEGGPGEGSRTLGEDIDLTGYMDGGRVAIYTRTIVAASPYDTLPQTLTGNETDTMTYGWALWDHRVRWTMAPQRYRWRLRSIVLNGDEPYRRIYPRDDGRAGGGARTWPPSKTVQNGTRTVGGYL